MPRYHETKKGGVAECRATVKGCPLGEGVFHAESEEAVYAHIEKANADKLIPAQSEAEKQSSRVKSIISKRNSLYASDEDLALAEKSSLEQAGVISSQMNEMRQAENSPWKRLPHQIQAGDSDILRKYGQMDESRKRLNETADWAKGVLKTRKTARAAGVTAEYPEVTVPLSTLKANSLTINQSGELDNAWISSVDENGDRSFDKVKGIVVGNTEHSPLSLLTESGRKVQALTHYANYRKNVTDFDVVIDDKSASRGSSPFESHLGFGSSIDTGD